MSFFVLFSILLARFTELNAQLSDFGGFALALVLADDHHLRSGPTLFLGGFEKRQERTHS